MIRVGTSGWNYDHWKGAFYPDGLHQSDWLGYYAQRFSTVEVNNTFYSLPEQDTVDGWRQTPERGFLFSVKASRYLTHMKKLKQAPESLAMFLGCAEAFGDKLGPLLFQLPPNWHANPDRLQSFIESLESQATGSPRAVFEFRDESWFTDEVYRVLADHDCAFCIYELAGMQSPSMVTSTVVYVRLHGPGDAYEGSYDDQVLGTWANRLAEWASEGRDVFCYFDNDQNGYAASNATTLQTMLR